MVFSVTSVSSQTSLARTSHLSRQPPSKWCKPPYKTKTIVFQCCGGGPACSPPWPLSPTVVVLDLPGFLQSPPPTAVSMNPLVSPCQSPNLQDMEFKADDPPPLWPASALAPPFHFLLCTQVFVFGKYCLFYSVLQYGIYFRWSLLNVHCSLLFGHY